MAAQADAADQAHAEEVERLPSMGSQLEAADYLAVSSTGLGASMTQAAALADSSHLSDGTLHDPTSPLHHLPPEELQDRACLQAQEASSLPCQTVGETGMHLDSGTHAAVEVGSSSEQDDCSVATAQLGQNMPQTSADNDAWQLLASTPVAEEQPPHPQVEQHVHHDADEVAHLLLPTSNSEGQSEPSLGSNAGEAAMAPPWSPAATVQQAAAEYIVSDDWETSVAVDSASLAAVVPADAASEVAALGAAHIGRQDAEAPGIEAPISAARAASEVVAHREAGDTAGTADNETEEAALSVRPTETQQAAREDQQPLAIGPGVPPLMPAGSLSASLEPPPTGATPLDAATDPSVESCSDPGAEEQHGQDGTCDAADADAAADSISNVGTTTVAVGPGASISAAAAADGRAGRIDHLHRGNLEEEVPLEVAPLDDSFCADNTPCADAREAAVEEPDASWPDDATSSSTPGPEVQRVSNDPSAMQLAPLTQPDEIAAARLLPTTAAAAASDDTSGLAMVSSLAVQECIQPPDTGDEQLHSPEQTDGPTALQVLLESLPKDAAEVAECEPHSPADEVHAEQVPYSPVLQKTASAASAAAEAVEEDSPHMPLRHALGPAWEAEAVDAQHLALPAANVPGNDTSADAAQQLVAETQVAGPLAPSADALSREGAAGVQEGAPSPLEAAVGMNAAGASVVQQHAVRHPGLTSTTVRSARYAAHAAATAQQAAQSTTASTKHSGPAAQHKAAAAGPVAAKPAMARQKPGALTKPQAATLQKPAKPAAPPMRTSAQGRKVQQHTCSAVRAKLVTQQMQQETDQELQRVLKGLQKGRWDARQTRTCEKAFAELERQERLVCSARRSAAGSNCTAEAGSPSGMHSSRRESDNTDELLNTSSQQPAKGTCRTSRSPSKCGGAHSTSVTINAPLSTRLKLAAAVYGYGRAAPARRQQGM